MRTGSVGRKATLATDATPPAPFDFPAAIARRSVDVAFGSSVRGTAASTAFVHPVASVATLPAGSAVTLPVVRSATQPLVPVKRNATSATSVVRPVLNGTV